MVRTVLERHGRDHQIAAVFHPDAEGDVLETKHGNIRVCKGDSAYQLTTGEVIKI